MAEKSKSSPSSKPTGQVTNNPGGKGIIKGNVPTMRNPPPPPKKKD